MLISMIIIGYVAYRLKIIIDYKNKKVFIRTIFKKHVIDFKSIEGMISLKDQLIHIFL
jgi:hypothetical protein